LKRLEVEWEVKGPQNQFFFEKHMNKGEISEKMRAQRCKKTDVNSELFQNKRIFS